MQKNEISSKQLNANALSWISKMQNTLSVKEFGKGTIKSYVNETVLLLKYYNHMLVQDLRQEHIETYIRYIKDVHGVGRAKCRSVAQACSFFLSG